MSYKYLDAYSSIGDKIPKSTFKDAYQASVTDLFYESSDWQTVGEETVYASGKYSDLDVRVNNVVFGRTGLPQGDDYKVLIYENIDHEVKLGYMYFFESNYWIVINVMRKPSLQASATVKRCNNMLKWMTDDGALFEVPCSIEYGIKENRDYSTAGSKVVSPSGLLAITTQLNENTNTIAPNQRFLFGNPNRWTGYRVMGGGIENFNNYITDQNSVSNSCLRLTMNADYVNVDSDDLTNGIAGKEEFEYTIEVSESGITGNPSDTIQLYSVVKLNGETVDSVSVVWSSSDELVATVDSSGLVSFVADGSCSVTCSIENNSSINDACGVIVVSTPVSEYQVIVSPLENFVIEDEDNTYTTSLYLNGILQLDTFVFSLNAGTVPSDNYTYSVVSGNSFKIENHKKYLSGSLSVTCTSGIHVTVIEVLLKGAW